MFFQTLIAFQFIFVMKTWNWYKPCGCQSPAGVASGAVIHTSVRERGNGGLKERKLVFAIFFENLVVFQFIFMIKTLNWDISCGH